MTGIKNQPREGNGQFAFQGGSGKTPPISVRALFAPMIELSETTDPYATPSADTPDKIVATYKAFQEAKANGTLLPPVDEEEESMLGAIDELEPYLQAMGLIEFNPDAIFGRQGYGDDLLIDGEGYASGGTDGKDENS